MAAVSQHYSDSNPCLFVVVVSVEVALGSSFSGKMVFVIKQTLSLLSVGLDYPSFHQLL